MFSLLDLRGKNELEFGTQETIDMDTLPKYRNTLSAYVCDTAMPPKNVSCSLEHLYCLLNTNRLVIPNHLVWSKAMQRTVCAFSNIAPDDNA